MMYHFSIWNNNKYEHKFKKWKSMINIIFWNNTMTRILAIKL
jgi:hypothetical protein